MRLYKSLVFVALNVASLLASDHGPLVQYAERNFPLNACMYVNRKLHELVEGHLKFKVRFILYVFLPHLCLYAFNE